MGFDKLDIKERSIASEEAQLSGSDSPMQTPKGSCGSNNKMTMPFGDNDKLFAEEIHYMNVSSKNKTTTNVNQFLSLDAKEIGISQEFLNLLQGVSTP